ncbi:hypothetical protein EPO04_04250 [Patescibacteria group bacterium]|nr:MAG: hypothetical protein EPO04_04250 [Patescibacteria group bacterium]
MSSIQKFRLRNDSFDMDFGTITFNGKFVFELSESIPLETWKKIGIIPTDNKKKVISNDLFEYLNTRLPMDLRKKGPTEKLDYIKSQGLRVTSDSFYLQQA